MCYSPGPLYCCQRIVNKAERREQEGSTLGCMRVQVFHSFCACECCECTAFRASFFFWVVGVVFVCVVERSSGPAPFGSYPTAVLQARETSERQSPGRLGYVSREHLSYATNPPTKLKEAPTKPYEAFMRARQDPAYPPTTDLASQAFVLLMLKVSSVSGLI